MNANISGKNQPVVATSQCQRIHRYPASDVDAECKRIIDWFADHLFLTTEECAYELKIVNPNQRIRALRQKGHSIQKARVRFYTSTGTYTTTTVYFLNRKLKAETHVMAEVKRFVSRLPGFEKTDVDGMPWEEQALLCRFVQEQTKL